MKRATVIGLSLALLALACTEKGTSVVLVKLTAASGVTGVEEVMVHVVGPDGRSIHNVNGGSPAPELKLGVILDKNVSGEAFVEACGFKTGHELIASAVRTRIKVVPGGTIGPLNVELGPDRTASPVCGASGGGGGTSGSGGGGAGGSAGSAGGAGGVGGSVAGSGGVAGSAGGRGGTGGTAGSGGTGGTGGAVAGAGGRGGSSGGGTGGSSGGGTGGGTATFDWRAARVISGDSVAETRPSVAVHFNGDAVVVMEHGGEIWFTRYSAALDMWTPQSLLATPNVSTTFATPLVVVDGAGRYMAVWGPGTNNSGIWLRTSDDGVNWGAITMLNTSTDYAFMPAIAVNSDGMAIVAWRERLSNNNQQLIARVRSTSGAWTPADLMLPADDANDRIQSVAVSGAGEAFVVWEQRDGTIGMNTIWGRQYVFPAGWGAAVPLESYDGGRAYAPAVAANPAGNAIVTYLQRVGSSGTASLWARRYTGAAWGTALKVAESTNIDSSQAPAVTLDNAGTATVAFGMESAGRYNVYTSRQAQSETAWPTSPMAMETDNMAADDSAGTFGATARATLPSVRNDLFGNVVLIWRKRVGPPDPLRFDLYARRYAGGSWGAAQLIETLDTGATPSNPATVFNPVLGSNGAGETIATWYYGGTNVSLDVYASVLRLP